MGQHLLTGKQLSFKCRVYGIDCWQLNAYSPPDAILFGNVFLKCPKSCILCSSIAFWKWKSYWFGVIFRWTTPVYERTGCGSTKGLNSQKAGKSWENVKKAFSWQPILYFLHYSNRIHFSLRKIGLLLEVFSLSFHINLFSEEVLTNWIFQ